MALVKCSDCGKEVSDSAKACPSCGKPTAAKKKSKFSKGEKIGLIVTAIILVVFIGGVIIGKMESDRKMRAQIEETFFRPVENGITLPELAEAFEDAVSDITD